MDSVRKRSNRISGASARVSVCCGRVLTMWNVVRGRGRLELARQWRQRHDSACVVGTKAGGDGSPARCTWQHSGTRASCAPQASPVSYRCGVARLVAGVMQIARQVWIWLSIPCRWLRTTRWSSPTPSTRCSTASSNTARDRCRSVQLCSFQVYLRRVYPATRWSTFLGGGTSALAATAWRRCGMPRFPGAVFTCCVWCRAVPRTLRAATRCYYTCTVMGRVVAMAAACQGWHRHDFVLLNSPVCVFLGVKTGRGP